MRPECAWSMSTVGLTAQEISFPIENPFLRGSYCHSMAGSKSSWSYRTEPNNFYFSMERAQPEHSSPTQQKGLPPPSQNYERHKHSPNTQRLPPKKCRPSHLSLSCTAEPSTPSPTDDDQVVPSFHRLSVNECSSPPQTPGRCSKPLPPIPPQTDFEQAIDNEVEFLTSTDDSLCLVSDQCPKSFPFRYGALGRRSFRDCGQINYAYSYYDGPLRPQSQKQPQQHQQMHPPQEVREQQQQNQQHQHQHQQQQQQQHQHHQQQQQQQQQHHHHHHHQQQQQQHHQHHHQQQHHQHHHQQQHQEPPQPVVCQRQQDKAQRRLRRSHSGPAGSFNKPSLRLACHKRYTHSMDKPEVPPPIPPRTKTGDYRRWSAEVSSGAYSDEDRPPKVPPREPLSRGSSRTPSPKSLPTYINGVMPPTQSFAPDPKYVSFRGLQRQNSEGSPCIRPVMENGEKVSNTHYYILAQETHLV